MLSSDFPIDWLLVTTIVVMLGASGFVWTQLVRRATTKARRETLRRWARPAGFRLVRAVLPDPPAPLNALRVFDRQVDDLLVSKEVTLVACRDPVDPRRPSGGGAAPGQRQPQRDRSVRPAAIADHARKPPLPRPRRRRPRRKARYRRPYPRPAPRRPRAAANPQNAAHRLFRAPLRPDRTLAHGRAAATNRSRGMSETGVGGRLIRIILSECVLMH